MSRRDSKVTPAVGSELVAEASELNWPPGFHPDSIFHQGKLYNLVHEERYDGDVKFWVYREVVMIGLESHIVPGGRAITVYND